jgi:hypothetical protein
MKHGVVKTADNEFDSKMLMIGSGNVYRCDDEDDFSIFLRT